MMFEDLMKQAGLGDQGGDLMKMIGSHIQGQGGLQGLVEGFSKQGLGDQAASWVSTGENQPISPEQAHGFLGNDFIQNAAKQFGISPDMIAQAASQFIPGMVDKATPGGQIPQGGDIMSALPGMLGGLFGNK